MKKLVLAVAVPLALVGAATLYTSTQVESTARDAVEQANVQLREMSVGAGAEVAVKMLSFESGLLSSNARYQVDIQAQDSDGEPRQFTVLLQDRIEHGPFPVSRLTNGQLMPVAAQSHFRLERSAQTEALFEAASGENPLVGDVAFGYDGSQQGALRSAPLNFANEDGTVRVAAGTLNFEGADETTTVRLEGQLPEIDMNLQNRDDGKPVRVQLSGIGMTVDKHDYVDGFGQGPSAITLEHMEIQADDNPAVVIKNASIEEASSRSSDGFDQSIAYRIGEVGANGQSIRNLTLALSLRNLDEGSLKALVESYKQILDSAATPQEALDNITDVQQQELQALALQLQEHKPTVALDEFGFETANGAARLSVVADLQAPSSEASTPDAMIISMLASLKAEAGIAKGLVRDVASLIAQREPQYSADPAALQQQADLTTELFSGMALGAGWFQLQGDRLVSSLHYADNKVTLNGQDMTVQEFIGFAFGSVLGAGLLGQ